MPDQPLAEQHLADLHDRAQELGVPRFRLLTREKLIDAIEGAERDEKSGGSPGRDAPEGEDRRSSSGRRRGRRGGRGRSRGGQGREGREGSERRGRDEEKGDEPQKGRDRGRDRDRDRDGDADRDREPAEEAETEPVSGVLDRMPQGYGFLRLSGLDGDEGDVYVSASQIRRCELRPGDEVSGPAREPRRGERHRALVRVDSVNGQEPEGERLEFEDLTAVAPTRRISMAEGEPLARAV
jgi:transcription termination factor Rho